MMPAREIKVERICPTTQGAEAAMHELRLVIEKAIAGNSDLADLIGGLTEISRTLSKETARSWAQMNLLRVAMKTLQIASAGLAENTRLLDRSVRGFERVLRTELRDFRALVGSLEKQLTTSQRSVDELTKELTDAGLGLGRK